MSKSDQKGAPKGEQTNQSEETISGTIRESVRTLKQNAKALKVLSNLPKSNEIEAAKKSLVEATNKEIAVSVSKVQKYFEQTLRDILAER